MPEKLKIPTAIQRTKSHRWLLSTALNILSLYQDFYSDFWPRNRFAITVLHYKCTKRKAPFHMTCNKGQFDIELMMNYQLSNSMHSKKKGNFECKIFGFPWFSWKIKAYPSTQKGYPLYSKKSLKSSIGLNGISTAKEDGFFRRLPPEISRQNEESDAFGRRRSRRRRSVAGSTSFGVEEERSKLGHRR